MQYIFVLLTELLKVPLADVNAPADANLPAESAAIVNPSAPANKFVSSSASEEIPVTAYKELFVTLSKFSVLMRSVTVLPSKYDTDDRLEVVIVNKLLALLRSVTVLPSKVDTEERLLFMIQ